MTKSRGSRLGAALWIAGNTTRSCTFPRIRRATAQATRDARRGSGERRRSDTNRKDSAPEVFYSTASEKSQVTLNRVERILAPLERRVGARESGGRSYSG